MSSAFNEVMAVRGRGAPKDGEVSITGSDPVLSTRFRIGETCAAVVAGIGVAAADLWEQRTGRRQHVRVDTRHAAAALRSSHYLRRADSSGAFTSVVSPDHGLSYQLTQPWATKDGRWALPHFSLPNLRARMLKLLGCEPTPDSVSAAVAKWDALELEGAIDEARCCGGMVRSNAEWLAEPHGQVLAAKPIVEIIRIGDSEPEPLPDIAAGADARPLSGVRVLDLTRILAGPIAARTLTEHGADVLMVTAKDLPQIPEHVMDTSHGKRSCFLDLREPEQAARLMTLVQGADVFSQGYRPGALERLGFGPEALAAERPGLVYVSISCYGADGPLSHRAGWEQVAQTMTGIAQEGIREDRPEGPALLPAAANDYTTGYLAAYGVMLALARRAEVGGSYHVRVSLCRSGMFIYQQGKVAFPGFGLELASDVLDGFRIETRTQHGVLRHLSPILQLSETQPRWDRPTPVLGGDAPEWAPAIAAAAE